MKNPLSLYKKFFIDKEEERLGLFILLNKHYAARKGIYPGSFVHITPSFIIPEMVYVDSDGRCSQFFSSCEGYIREHKQYKGESRFRFHHQDFSVALPEEKGMFDLLISFYAGFISESCIEYIRPGGILLANDSHGDASLAYLNPEYILTAIVHRYGEDHKRNSYHGKNFSISSENLDSYFKTKSGLRPDKATIHMNMRGGKYTKQPYAYIFTRVRTNP